MCGIFGFTNRGSSSLSPALARSILERLEHRGPDDRGWLTFRAGAVRRGRRIEDGGMDAEAMLMHRRLSILDLSDAGWQPMSTAEGRYHLTFNGEIYNYLELRRELERLGHTFQSETDTEVLLAAFVQWGAACLPRFIGMFAFAVLDSVERKLFLARDFFGIKPLYYARWQHGFAFSSEIKALLEMPGVQRVANSERLYEYLRFGITDHGGETLFAGIQQLPAAHYLEISLDSSLTPEPVRYWSVDMGERLDLSFDEAADRLRELFLENIRLHLRSDVAVGAALSGGIDSSSIVMAMRHLEPGLDLHTFSYVADDAALSEEKWVDVVGQAAGAVVHKVRPSREEMVSDLDRLITVQEQPFGSTSIYAQYRVFRLAHETGIKVMLDGQGADELLAGYPWYAASRLASLIQQGKFVEAFRFLGTASKNPRHRWLWMKLGEIILPSSLQSLPRRLVGEEVMPEWLNARWFARQGVVGAPLTTRSGRDELRFNLHRTLTQHSVPRLLRYEDRNSMAFSIESRVPFLTPGLANFLFALPEEYLLDRNVTTKSVFRKAMRGIVPDEILNRKDKIGFSTPERDWLISMRPWVDGVLHSEAAERVPALNITAVRAEWEAVCQGRKRFDARLWRWINLIRWAEAFAVTFEK